MLVLHGHGYETLSSLLLLSIWLAKSSTLFVILYFFWSHCKTLYIFHHRFSTLKVRVVMFCNAMHSQYLTPIPRTVAREVCETGYFVAQDTYLKYHRSHGSAQTYSGVLTVRTNRHLEKVKTRWIFRIHIKRFDCLINVRKFKNVNITLFIPSLLCCSSSKWRVTKHGELRIVTS